MSHSLVEIPPREWNILLELYSEKRLEPTGYNTINNYIEWIKKDPDMEVKCFSLDGDWQSDGTFIFIDNNYGTETKRFFFNTLSNNLDRLTRALLCLTSEKYVLYGFGERLLPAADKFTQVLNINPRHLLKTTWYRASKEVVAAFTIEPPSGITLRKLELEDAPTINEIWPHRCEGSIRFVKCLINHNISVGAYDNNGKLVAWCLRLPLGSLGLLQVLETHKRLGLGSLLVRYMSKKISELNEEVLSGVVTENTPSRKMFEKLGFEQIDHCYWDS